ncbi:MAG: YceI family protein, partial [Actinomycetota bacterium]|nr:YceI family protein [Actinomycetota bacterium]
MTTQTTPVTGAFHADPVHSSFGFAVRHMGISAFRGTLTDVDATLRRAEAGAALRGAARVESISVQTPPELREHLLAPDFFDAERHAEVTFESTEVQLGEDGRATVQGELTIKGVTRPVTLDLTFNGVVTDPYGNTKAGFEAETEISRKEWGLT